eukprot:gnl/MRDRNA2_/MRDRNA2_77515_c0_seq1.p1 gnl/MRDRNA2_/MRDRNA2_77515_c0~~gnl/MRDRNA2_/MRDRNA2_77515_c0_seq1.p1  ORF type:complete len:166 (-),score=10.61 gnl/MRDRNA2_/MRDRNA2_77515_c0_seq1:33-530(-)
MTIKGETLKRRWRLNHLHDVCVKFDRGTKNPKVRCREGVTSAKDGYRVKVKVQNIIDNGTVPEHQMAEEREKMIEELIAGRHKKVKERIDKHRKHKPKQLVRRRKNRYKRGPYVLSEIVEPHDDDSEYITPVLIALGCFMLVWITLKKYWFWKHVRRASEPMMRT